MKIFEIKTKNGRSFRVLISNESQMKRLTKLVNDNKKKSYEVFTSVKCIKNGIQDIKSFEAIAINLV